MPLEIFLIPVDIPQLVVIVMQSAIAQEPLLSLSLKLRWKIGEKGLRFLYGSKYTPSHKCSKSQLYQLLTELPMELDVEAKSPISEEFKDYHEQLEVV